MRRKIDNTEGEYDPNLLSSLQTNGPCRKRQPNQTVGVYQASSRGKRSSTAQKPIALQSKDIGEATTKKDFHEPTEKQFGLIGLQELNYNYATKQAYGGTSTVTT